MAEGDRAASGYFAVEGMQENTLSDGRLSVVSLRVMPPASGGIASQILRKVSSVFRYSDVAYFFGIPFRCIATIFSENPASILPLFGCGSNVIFAPFFPSYPKITHVVYGERQCIIQCVPFLVLQ